MLELHNVQLFVGWEQKKPSQIRSGLFDHVLRRIVCRFDVILSCLRGLGQLILDSIASSYLLLVLIACNNANDAPAQKDSSKIGNESRAVMKLRIPTVLETMLYLLFARFVEKSRNVEKLVIITRKTERFFAPATQSLGHAS